MENKTQMKKLYDIARSSRTTDEFVSYIEYVSQRVSFSARDLANKIYKAAMTKYDATIHERVGAIKVNTDSVADQMYSVKAFARKYGVMFDYTFYLERLVLNGERFDMTSALNRLAETAITIYDMRLRRKIDTTTGITIIGGYKDAV